ncbi:MAG: porin family protein [Marinobacter sp.]|nr:porin family protein [Marinobacter sp.]
MTRVNTVAISLCLLVGALPMAASAQSPLTGPALGDREFSISGTGSNDRSFNSGGFGVSGDLGWYLQNDLVAGIRQSVNYASIKGESIKDDFWNGSTRGYLNYQFLDGSARPFVGASLGAVYGDGVKNSTFAGLETGLKHYVLNKTYFLARVEYQFLFTSTRDASNSFRDDGAWAYTVGLGYNF